jgi:hypothetical protein
MSPWEVIGWTIAIPMVLTVALFVLAIIIATVKSILKPRKPSENHPAGKRHLRLVEDE